ncbi:TM2 domain-containing protein 1 isoform X1 [Moschus berezovskii]|uniref:TM2 domain-containing protein 1 isoform X1 n=1 Tax=Moschus berezovskii TaxID=68408 RepID=UPI0024442410|nr:TM2 domain-containing protein 1 isoform X1 [Moschus berezovskii]
MAAACPCRPIAPETAAARLLGVLWFVSVTTGPWGAAAGGGEETLKCEDLKVGQYICKDPKINDATQEPVNCTNYTAYVQCFPAPNITCKDFGGNETHFTGNEVGFLKPIPCRNVNGYSYKVAVALSLFLGWLGADRFYLGYPALGPHTSQLPSFIPFPCTGRTLHCVLTDTLQVLFKIQWYRILNHPAFLSFLHPSVRVIDPSASVIFSLPWHLCWNGPSQSI